MEEKKELQRCNQVIIVTGRECTHFCPQKPFSGSLLGLCGNQRERRTKGLQLIKNGMLSRTLVWNASSNNTASSEPLADKLRLSAMFTLHCGVTVCAKFLAQLM
jgi:hypothetical protein